MKTLVCIYCEGNDSKIAVVAKDKDTLRLLKAADFDVMSNQMADVQSFSAVSLEGMSGDISLGDMEKPVDDGSMSVSSEGLINTALADIKLENCEFVPAITEPAVHYHVYEGSRDADGSNGPEPRMAKLTEEIVSDIQKTKNITVAKENLGYTKLADGPYLSVFADGEINCISTINSLAHLNGKKFYKIPAVKCADLSLAYFVAQKKKFFPDDYSLIVYIGKEYSKLIFLKGKNLKHIGTTLDVGTANLHTYDVYFSKILLEMENGGIPRIDNVVLCGEDESENLALSFYGTFPEANVSKLDFEGVDITRLDENLKEKLSSFSVPVAVAYEYFAEMEKSHKGINLLPQYVREDQKFFQFAWHSFIILPFIFLATIYFTFTILVNTKQTSTLNQEIAKLTLKQQQNQQILDQISNNQNKINNFGATQAILDSATKGAEVWGGLSKKMADFVSSRKSMWITSLSSDPGNQVTVNGYGLTRSVLTEFSDKNDALLKSIVFESLRNKNAYKFTLSFDMSKNPGQTK
ncbi:MAG: PilN domain-containing protein [Ignavibacteriales bacterium]